MRNWRLIGSAGASVATVGLFIASIVLWNADHSYISIASVFFALVALWFAIWQYDQVRLN